MNLSEVFKSGELYPLKVIDLKSIEKDQYYLLQTEVGTKILLPYKLYANYGFEKGSTIQCRLDKINCNGRLFFEPMHPFYKVGQAYHFTIEGEEILSEGLDKVWTLKDTFGNSIKIPAIENSMLKVGDKVSCYLKSIKKSHLYFIPEVYLSLNYNTDSLHQFLISGIYTDVDEYYILKHSITLEKIVLKSGKYEGYGFKVGDLVRCRCIKSTSFPHYIFEPEHPQFNIGWHYFFSVTLIEDYLLDEIQQVISLIDKRGNKAKLLLVKRQDYVVGQNVSCKLVDIRSGKLIIEPEND
ncbi:MAG: hypothetical protein WCH34_09670 [Bacteroidota bacterium]